MQKSKSGICLISFLLFEACFFIIKLMVGKGLVCEVWVNLLIAFEN